MYHVGDTQEEDFGMDATRILERLLLHAVFWSETNLQVMCKINWISRRNLLQITLLSTEKILHY